MTVETYKAPSMFAGDNWCARCTSCREVLTKYCDTEDQARREAGSEPHSCPRSEQESNDELEAA